jgi:Na+/proline symporter
MGVFGSVIKRFCTVGWGLVGLFGIALFAGHELLDPAQGGGPDNIFPVASGALLPVGLRGLMVASMLAAVMSSLDAGVLSFAGLFVNNFYQEHFVKNATPSHYLFMTRVTAVVSMLLGWWVATGAKDIVEFTTIVEPLNSLTGVAILAALMWRRVTGYGAIASVLVAAPLFLAVNKPGYSLPLMDTALFDLMHLRPVADWMAGLYGLDLLDPALGYLDVNGALSGLPVQIKYPMYLIPTLLTLIVVSLLTKQHNQRAVEEFYCRLDTPVGQEHEIAEAGFEVDQLEHLDRHDPELVREKLKEFSGDRRLLLADLFRMPKLLVSGEAKLSDYKWDWIGLFGGIAFVWLFLFGVTLLGRLF